MDLIPIQFTNDGRPQSASMADYLLISPDGRHRIELYYETEPPHGDSIHRVIIDGQPFPGFAWGCLFAFSACSRFAVFSWMRVLVERLTVVVDLDLHQYFVLPSYIHQFRVAWPSIIGEGRYEASAYSFSGSEGLVYTFGGSEKWVAY